MAANYTVKDAGQANITIAADELATGIYSPCTTQLVGGSKISSTNPMPVNGNLTITSGSFTRPNDTTAYAVGDAVANSTSAAGLVTLANVTRTAGGTGYIVRAAFATDQKSNTSSYRFHIFNNSTATISNDNAPFRELYADMSKKVGSFVLGPMSTPADTTNSTISRAEDAMIRLPFQCEAGSRDLYFAVETLTANTPVGLQGFTLRVATDNN